MNKIDILGSGLVNMGNTCFFNATVQCLLHSAPFSKDLIQKRHSNNCNFNQWCVYCEIEDTWIKTKSTKVFEPRKLVQNLKKLFKKFKLGRQQDSHQFLRYFIQGLQKSDIGSKQKNPQKIKMLVQNSKIFSLFGGIMKSTVQCESCHYKSQIIEHSYDLSLQCQRSNSIQQSLTNFFRVDHLSGNNKYQCSSCKKLVNAKKYFLFNRLPNVLTIQLKRFTNNLHKLNKFVQFSQTLQLQKYCQNNISAEYKLTGVVVHAGSSSFSGHYYSYNKVGIDWFKMDDSSVSKVEKETVLNQRAYLLFYEKIKNINQQGGQETKQVQLQTKLRNQKQQTKKQQRPGQYKEFFSQISQAINKRNQNENEFKTFKKLEQTKKDYEHLPKSKQAHLKTQIQFNQQHKAQNKNTVLQLNQPSLLRRLSSSGKSKNCRSSRIRNSALQKLRNYNIGYYYKQMMINQTIEKDQSLLKSK